MIAPYRHLAVFARAPREASDELADLLKVSLRVLKRAYRPQGFNAGMNFGRSAGAGIVDHYHLHVVPRWPGDSNFMPLIAETRVFIEDLDRTYSLLAPLFAKEAAGGKKEKGR
jgi:ATP adenylyltransferase